MSKMSMGKTLRLIGLDRRNNIRPIKDVICFRKPMDIGETKRTMKHYKTAIGMVSAHNIYRKANTPYCKAWCHCFRDPRKFFPKQPIELLSESDFVDPLLIPVQKRGDSFQRDFFYFTIGGPLGAEYKGINLFSDTIDILCGKHKLNGLIIKYANRKAPLYMNKRRKGVFNKYRKNLQVISKKLNPHGIAKIMQTSRFGFFPNHTDCSPLMITESLVRDCPVMISRKILGGWKYADPASGCEFYTDDIDKKIDFMMSNKFSPREFFMSSYGYLNTSKRLASFAGKYIPQLKGYKAIGIRGSERAAQAYWKKI